MPFYPSSHICSCSRGLRLIQHCLWLVNAGCCFCEALWYGDTESVVFVYCVLYCCYMKRLLIWEVKMTQQTSLKRVLIIASVEIQWATVRHRPVGTVNKRHFNTSYNFQIMHILFDSMVSFLPQARHCLSKLMGWHFNQRKKCWNEWVLLLVYHSVPW